MNFKNLNVDNYVIASIIDAISETKVKLFNLDNSNQESQFFFLPLGMVKENIVQYPLDTFGILNKKKLLMREPITGDQISYINNINQFDYTDKNNVPSIKTVNSKIFYFYELNSIPHKYKNSIFTNLKSKNINVIFPDSNTIHVISDEILNLKKYVKKLSNKIVNIQSIRKIILPKEISIIKDNQIINSVNINNNTYLGMTYQISQILRELLKDIKFNIKASENNNNYINKIFFTFYSFIPNFVTPFLFRFLLRLNTSRKFANQILEIDNYYNSGNYFFSNPIDDEFSIGGLAKGKFLPKIIIKEKNKELNDLLSSEINVICSSNKQIKSKKNVIYLKTHSNNKGTNGFTISESSFEHLNLENCYYEVSSTGLILMVELNRNIHKKSKSDLISNYSDQKQRSLDSFDTKNFKPSLPKLPKLKFHLTWPLKPKNQ